MLSCLPGLMCMICLQGNGKLIFQGIISYLACILITYLGFAMMRFGNIEQKYMRKLDGAAHSVSQEPWWHGQAAVCFTPTTLCRMQGSARNNCQAAVCNFI